MSRLRCPKCREIWEGEVADDGYAFCPACRAVARRMDERAPELARLLEQVERGEITLTPLDDPGVVWAGNVEYSLSTGHRLVVFNGCNSWDYVDSIFAPSGELLWDYPDGQLRGGNLVCDAVMGYRPPPGISQSVYGIPE